MKEETPRVSMEVSAHYVGQGHVYDTVLRGPLTDRRIEYYARRGRYGPEEKKAALARQRAKKKGRVRVLPQFVA